MREVDFFVASNLFVRSGGEKDFPPNHKASFLCVGLFACLLALPLARVPLFPLLVSPSANDLDRLCLQIELEAILGLNQDLLPPLDENGQIIPNKLSKVRMFATLIVVT